MLFNNRLCDKKTHSKVQVRTAAMIWHGFCHGKEIFEVFIQQELNLLFFSSETFKFNTRVRWLTLSFCDFPDEKTLKFS